MKSFIVAVLFLFFAFEFGRAQDSLVILSAKMFNNNQAILLSPIDGWLFKPGNDLSRANKDLEVRDWKRMNPTGLSASYADKTGRAEGWFRLKFQLDSYDIVRAHGGEIKVETAVGEGSEFIVQLPTTPGIP